MVTAEGRRGRDGDRDGDRDGSLRIEGIGVSIIVQSSGWEERSICGQDAESCGCVLTMAR